MLLLVSGASGMGKSTVREIVAPRILPLAECVELVDLGAVPAIPTKHWRQQMAEVAVARARQLSAEGRHLVLSGDPVAPGEVLAAPSADGAEIAACVLYARPEVQEARLTARGDPAAGLPDHLAFADWMRKHATSPRYRPHVLTEDGWDGMLWDRWMTLPEGDPRWTVSILDTSDLTREAVAERIETWIRAAIDTGAGVMRPGGWGERLDTANGAGHRE